MSAVTIDRDGNAGSALLTVAAATKSEAEDKMALIQKLPTEMDALSLLAEGVNFDFASKGMDTPLTDEELGFVFADRKFGIKMKHHQLVSLAFAAELRHLAGEVPQAVQVEHDRRDGGEEEVHGSLNRVWSLEYRVWSGLNKKRAGLMTAWRAEWRTELKMGWLNR